MTLDLAATPATSVSAAELEALRGRLSGDLLLPGAAAYEEARLAFNRSFQRHPVAIVQPVSPADVAAAVAFARHHGLPLAVKGGGHSVPGHSTTDGLLVDFARMKGLAIDPTARTARAEAGLRAGEVTAAAGEHGLAVPFGDTAAVGIAGLTLGGGIGYLVRRYGLTIDSLLEVEVVTADGRIVTASETENPDLFWALRGGGGNFGIATAFTYRLHPVGTIYGGMLALPATGDVLRSWAAAAAAAPRDLTTIGFLMHLPPLPFLAPELHGRLSLVVVAAWAGDLADGPAALDPFRAIAAPLADLLGVMPYAALYDFTEEAGRPTPIALRSAFLPDVDGPADDIIRFMEGATSPFAMAQLRVLGGAMADVPAGATAFAHRDETILFAIITPFQDDPAPHVEWTRAFFDTVRPATDAAYVNFLGDEGEARLRAAYPAATWARLARVKAAWDPENVFALNQNIPPAAG